MGSFTPGTRVLLFQNAVIMQRMFPPRLHKQGVPKTLKKREYIYTVIDNTDLQPAGEMPVILVKDVEGELTRLLSSQHYAAMC